MDSPLVDERKLKEAKRLEEVLRQQREQDVRDVLSTPTGRRFFWTLIDNVTNSHGGSFVGESPLTMAFNEGIRSVGLTLITDAKRIAPREYVQMVREQLDDLEVRARRAAAPDGVHTPPE